MTMTVTVTTTMGKMTKMALATSHLVCCRRRLLLLVVEFGFLTILLLLSRVSDQNTSAMEVETQWTKTMTATTTWSGTVVLIDCNGTSYQQYHQQQQQQHQVRSRQRGVIWFNNSTNISNCHFNNTRLRFSSSPPSPSSSYSLSSLNPTPTLVLNTQNCWFVNSTLIVKGSSIVEVGVDSTQFENSTLLIESKTARVVITNTTFVNCTYNLNPNWSEPKRAPLIMSGCIEVVIQHCAFMNLKSVAVKLLGVNQSFIEDSNFESTLISVYSSSMQITISRCNFSKSVDGFGDAIVAGPPGQFIKIEDTQFFDNIFGIEGGIISWALTIITRSVFRNNTVISNFPTYSQNGVVNVLVK